MRSSGDSFYLSNRFISPIDDSASLASSGLSRQLLANQDKSSISADNSTVSRSSSRSRSNNRSILNSNTSSLYQKSATNLNQSQNQKTYQPSEGKGRVKVGIRIRPPFQDEIDIADGNYFPIITCIPNQNENDLARVCFTQLSGKQIEYSFDFAFSELSTQDEVYESIAKPVVNDVLNGSNGTIFAYGQTGTGKTYTMGILERVTNENSGIIPRAISQIFSYIKTSNNDIRISLSFLQLYREIIQDLLVSNNTQIDEQNLNIREDPIKGFFVDGLQEFIVKSYSEAEALINFGLENRAMASTLMNTTSSRSHTILTLYITQSGYVNLNQNNQQYSRTTRSKLLLVDLAGSERVKRTDSNGVRLSEAKSINISLSALGKVISILASQNNSHIPYRDSKLTRLLQDSLGGTASTALIATVGPAPINFSETSSTLMFASRCMSVRTKAVIHEDIDYPELCARLQQKLSKVDEYISDKLSQQQIKYESTIEDLQKQMSEMRSENHHYNSSAQSPSSFDINTIQSFLELLATPSNISSNKWLENFHNIENADVLLGLIAYLYELLTSLNRDLMEIIHNNSIRQNKSENELNNRLIDEQSIDRIRQIELQAMQQNDQFSHKLSSSNVTIGKHLPSIGISEALTSVNKIHPNNNQTINSDNHIDNLINSIETKLSKSSDSSTITTKLNAIETPEQLANDLAKIQIDITDNLNVLANLMYRKDRHFNKIKDELIDELVERRKREEEVVNWSYILKYLLSNSSKLKKQLKQNKVDDTNTTNKPTTDDIPKELFDNEILQSDKSIITNNIPINISKRINMQPDNIPTNEVSINTIQRKTLQTENKQINKYDNKGIKQNQMTSFEMENISPVSIQNEMEDAESMLSFQSAATVRSIPLKVSQPPSLMAQGLVQDLGLEGPEAVKAMKIIDKISAYTPQQLEKLDSQTREEILSMRNKLGIDRYVAQQNQKQRSRSREKERPYQIDKPQRSDSPLRYSSATRSTNPQRDSSNIKQINRSYEQQRPTSRNNRSLRDDSFEYNNRSLDIRSKPYLRNDLIDSNDSLRRRPFELSDRSIESERASIMSEAYRIHRNGLTNNNTRLRSNSISSNRTSVLDIDLN